MTERTPQPEIKPDTLFQALLPFPGTRHMTTRATGLKVRPAHEGICAVMACQPMSVNRIKGTAAAAVTGGTADPIRQMITQAGPVAPEG